MQQVIAVMNTMVFIKHELARLAEKTDFTIQETALVNCNIPMPDGGIITSRRVITILRERGNEFDEMWLQFLEGIDDVLYPLVREIPISIEEVEKVVNRWIGYLWGCPVQDQTSIDPQMRITGWGAALNLIQA